MQRHNVTLLGQANCGKTSFITKITKNKYSDIKDETISVDVLGHSIIEQNIKYVFSVWDINGDIRFGCIKNSFCRNSNAIIFMYDVTNSSSLIYIEKMLQEYDTSDYSAMIKILVGTKIDKNTNILEKASILSEKYKLNHILISSKNGTNLSLVFKYISSEIESFVTIKTSYEYNPTFGESLATSNKDISKSNLRQCDIFNTNTKTTGVEGSSKNKRICTLFDVFNLINIKLKN